MGADADHPTDQTLRAYGLGKLDDVSCGSVSKHLESCPDCRRRVAEMSSDSFLGRLRDAQGSPEMSATGRSQLGGSFTDRGPAVAIAPPAADNLPPGLVDHPDYEVIRELGRGGMGVVYLVRNKLMGRLEVLKVVGGHLVERPGVRDRFLREVQSAAKLQHKNIVTAYSAMRLGESIVLAMEYVDGDDLAKEVKSGGPMPVINACYFIYQAALGLQHAHERGMVHRDIKPANLIVAREGKKAIVKVLDFGLAKVTSEGQADSGLTREGQMLGTPEYIAPEQIRDAQSADIRADIYSLGCTFYYLLTGGPPFRGEHLWDIYQAHFSMQAGPLNLVRPDVPVELAALVAKMMAKDPRRRFQTPGEVARELTRFFKPAASQPSASSAEMSRINPASTPTQTSGIGPAPARPATEGAVPIPARRGPSKPGAEGVAWESLIEFKETEESIVPAKPRPDPKPKPVLEPATAEAPVSQPPWVWASVAAGVLLLGLVAAWAAWVLKVKTPNGVIVLGGLPEQAEVLVDGGTVSVRWPDGGGPAEITVPAGKHKVKVKKDGIETSGDEVTVRAGGKEELTVRFVPLDDSRRGKDGPPADTSSRPNISKSASGKDQAWPDFVPVERDRRAAEAVLSLGGAVTIRGAEDEEEIKPGDGLPAAPFKLVRVKLVNKPELVDAGLEPLRGLSNVVEVDLSNAKNITDAGLERLQSLRQLDVLRLRETRVTDSGLVHLQALTKLRQLDLYHTQLTNEGLVNLRSLAQLESLNLGSTRVTGAGLVDLQKLTNLRHLYLWDQRVTDAGLAHLKGLGQLESLELVGSPVTDAGLAHLKGLTKLRHLSLYRTQVTGAGLADPQALGQINWLSLRWTPATDAGLVHLRNLPQLEWLDLADTTVTDAGIAHLRSLSQLKYLDLTKAKVTAAGVEGLKKSLPACRIIADPAALEKLAGSSASTVPTNGFVALFNGKDLSGWAGAVDDYDVVDGILSCKSGKPSVAIYEPVERSDFVARVEFRLASGAESGMEIRYSGQGNGGFTSMCEIQILDDTHPKYANVDARLFNGSAWGMAAAKRGHLKPLGEWNVQEVTVRGSTIKVELNGVVILDTDLAPIREFVGGKPHPGKDRTSGYFGIQSGPGTNQGSVQYRKIEIKELNGASGTAGLPASSVGSPTRTQVVKPTVPSAAKSKAQKNSASRKSAKSKGADALQQGSISNSIGMTLKLIPAGEFFMGSPDSDMEAEKHEKPSHRVRISKPFYLGVREVTQAQYEAVMGNNPSWFSANGGGRDKVAGQSTDRYPVENVSWLDAVQLCNKLSDKERKKPFYEIDGKDIRVPDWNGQGYRLPTEAEWEYACRANASTPTRYSFGLYAAELGESGWFEGNSENRTHPVGQKKPNGFGLYDMHGNVWEWCWDWYGEGYYNQSAADDPTGPAEASHRVIRGGSWGSGPRIARSALRDWYVPGLRFNDLGFRLVLGQSGR